MTHNLGSGDSFIRFMIGLSFLINIIILEPGAVGTVILLTLGVMFLASSWTNYCMAYKALGINTCPCGDCSSAACKE